VALAYLLGAFSNFFLRRNFVSDAVWAQVFMVTLGALVICEFTEQKESVGVMAQVDWRLLPAGY